ncbi:MAG TPA: hypothetical protein VMI92_09340 [Steroidobacteraceae bacterium]|nr:hypothetical protein [Steroidobacteraceae bacterium]
MNATTRTLGLALLLGSFAGGAAAETLVVNDQVTVRETSLATPGRGLTMTQVEKKFGAPTERHPAVGKPPITRWDYPGFSVFFEHQWVIHSVVTAPTP